MMTTPRFMEGYRVASTRAWIVCAAIATSGPGCGAEVEPATAASPPATTTATASGPWTNQPFTEQTQIFHAELDATPSASSIDAVVGLSDGPAADFADLAAIVRFNPDGTIDVRSGSSYRADVVRSYTGGAPYHFRLDIDLAAHTYSVWLREAGGYVRLAHGYPFRTEQAGAARLSNLASKVDSPTGTLDVSGFQIIADPTTMTGCLVARAGGGFVTVEVPDATVLSTTHFDVIPSAPDLDAVIGLSAGPPASFSDLATAVRLAPGGFIDVRDGDVYRADFAQHYPSSGPLLGEQTDVRGNHIEMIADVTSHTYSVFNDFFFELARQYQFRTQQRGVTHLQQLSVIVDGTEGSVAVCQAFTQASRGVVYSREGLYQVVPLADNEALLSDGATVSRVDAAGQTVAQLPTGGAIAADAAGNVFVAGVADTTLTIDKYDPGLAPRWRTTRAVPAGTTVRAIATDACGAVVIALDDQPQDPNLAVLRFTADGAFASQASVHGGTVALDGDQPIVAWSEPDQVRIARFAATGEVVWSRSFAGRAWIDVITVDPFHNVVFGGELSTEVDFGGGPLPLLENSDAAEHGFVVELSASGDHVFSTANRMSRVTGIASNGARLVVSGAVLTSNFHPRLQAYDAAGTPIPLSGLWDTSFGADSDVAGASSGFGDALAIGASGRIWWNLRFQELPGSSFIEQHYLVALHE